jgi:hypothetical protein
VKIMLCDGQEEMAKTMEPGGFYSICNLRLRKSTANNELQGRLGGTERLIQKLKSKDTENEELQALFL